MEFDPVTLETIGSDTGLDFGDKMSISILGTKMAQSAAHAQYDASTGEIFNYIQNPMGDFFGIRCNLLTSTGCCCC